MRIAQVSPLFESVPPKFYGGTERIVAYLTEELIKQGHDVTLFASGDSTIEANLVSTYPNALRMDASVKDPLIHHFVLMEEVLKRAENFDIIHYHTDFWHYPHSRRLKVPHLTTLHGRLDFPDLQYLYNEFCDIPLVSISDSQRVPLPQCNWVKTILHGLPINLYSGIEGKGKYLAFIGRFSPEKGVDHAIEIAINAGIPIKIAAKVEKINNDYFEEVIKPLLEHPLVEYIGEIGEKDKNEFLGNALGILFPITWPEPFGLAMIEAMACGTPVIAFNLGSVPEVMKDGVSGFIVESVEEAIFAAQQLEYLDRKNIRKYFEDRFSAHRMATEYLSLYEEMASVKSVSDSKGFNI